jgi:RNA polymerase sigma-70 factor (ECF subfamily)
MQSAAERAQFETATLPHLDAAYNLARWLTGNDHDAEDVVQEAYLRAQKFFAGCRGGDVRAWLLKVVRNTCYTWLHKNRPSQPVVPLDDERHAEASDALNPEQLLQQRIDHEAVRRAIEALPDEFREVIVLRELEGLSYQQIAEVAEVPLGTVMSRLSRARGRLQQFLADHVEKE